MGLCFALFLRKYFIRQSANIISNSLCS